MRVPFSVTDGPYAGKYDVETEDFTGSEIHRFRHAVGVTLQRGLSGEEIDLDVFCGLVWLMKTRGSGSKALPFQAVADQITARQIDMDLDEVAEQNKPVDVEDPTSGGAA